MRHHRLKKFLIPTALLGLLLSIAFYDVVFLGKTFKVTTANSQALPSGAYDQADNKPPFIPVNGTDGSVLEEPLYEFLKNNFRRGILPLWNPHQACGYPLIGMIQVGIFYPLNIIMYLLPSLYAWDLLILIRLFLAGLFTYGFMRNLGFRRSASLGSGIVFMLSGPMVLLQYWTANVDILAPLLLIASDRLIRRNSIRDMLTLSIIIALTVLGGHPEHIFLVNSFGLAYFIFRLIQSRPDVPVKKVISLYGVAVLFGIGLSAVVLFPFIKHLLFEFWHGHPPGVGLRMEEQPARALSLALPHFFQEVPLTYDWVFAGWWGGYLGILPLALAFLSLFKNYHKGLNYFFAVMATLIIAKQYGLPFINWIGHIPFFSMCRYAIHTPPLAALTVAILAGMGIQTIQEKDKLFIKGMIFAVILISIVGTHFFFLNSKAEFATALKASGFALIILIIFLLILLIREKAHIADTWIGCLLIVALFFELFSYIHREWPERFNSFPKVPYIEFLKRSPQPVRAYGNFWAFYPNTATGFEVDDLGFFFGMAPKRFVHFTNHLLVNNLFQKDLRPPALRAIPIQGREEILNLLNVRYIIQPATDDYQRPFEHFEDINQRLDAVYDREVKIYERPEAYPRVFITHRAVFQPDEQRTFQLINQLRDQLDKIVVLQSPPIAEVMQRIQGTPLRDASAATIVHRSANEVTVNAIMQNPGFLVLSEAFHPDWEATVNGRPWKIFQTDYLIRSVFLPAGIYQVRFIFRPFSFRLGLWVSLLTAVLALLMGMTPWLMERTKKVTLKKVTSDQSCSQ